MTVFSFHPVKHITTGEGGAITTNSKSIYEKLQALRNHGMHKDKKTAEKGPWYYDMRELGFNYRITDFQCALGLSQLKKLDNFIKERRRIAALYRSNLSKIDAIELQKPDMDSRHAWHLFVIRLSGTQPEVHKKALYNRLHNIGIGAQIHYIPVHLQPYYRRAFGYETGDFPKAENYYKRCISLPIFPGLKKRELNLIITAIKDFLS